MVSLAFNKFILMDFFIGQSTPEVPFDIVQTCTVVFFVLHLFKFYSKDKFSVYKTKSHVEPF